MSENVMLLHNNAVDRASIVTSSEVSSMPVTNLQDLQRSVVWRSAANGSQTIDITLAANEDQVQAFALVDHNLTLSGTVKIEAWSDAINGAVKVLDTTLQPYQPVYGYGDQLYGAGLYGGYDIYVNGVSIANARDILRPILMAQISPALSVRYWRITLNDSSVNYYQAGRIYLGPAWQPTTNFSWGSAREKEHRTRAKESRGGQTYSNPRPGRTLIDFDFQWLLDAERDQLWIIASVLGDYTPFIIVMKPVGGYEQESSTLYGVFESLPLRQEAENKAAAPAKFKESL